MNKHSSLCISLLSHKLENNGHHALFITDCCWCIVDDCWLADFPRWLDRCTLSEDSNYTVCNFVACSNSIPGHIPGVDTHTHSSVNLHASDPLIFLLGLHHGIIYLRSHAFHAFMHLSRSSRSFIKQGIKIFINY